MIITDQIKLREPCSSILPEEIDSVRQQLEQELQLSAQHGFPGLGLAAPQIGIYKKMAIIRLPSTAGHNFHVDLVNPVIIEKYDKFLFRDEGCLSFPGQVFKTMRYKEIVVENGIYPHRFIATGLFAVCIQHEVNHLDSILVTDIVEK